MHLPAACIVSALFLPAACAVAPQQPRYPAPVPTKIAVSEAPAEAAPAGIDAKALYAAKCAGCHAPDGSKGLKGKSAEYVRTALNGYKAKTYGGAKKEIMEGRAAALSDAEIQALATFVAWL